MNITTKCLAYPLHLALRSRASWLKQKNPVNAQKHLLPRLLEAASRTYFGRHYHFSQLARSSNCYEDYRESVPIRGYEAFQHDWFSRYGEEAQLDDVTWPGPVKWFCETSGTTAGSKRIPLTDQMFRMNRRAAFDMLSFYATTVERSAVLAGKILYMAGNTALSCLGEGVYSGDMSAITLVNRPKWLSGRVLPTEPLSSAAWNDRLQGMASLLINDTNVTMLSGVPPWILMLLREVERQSGVACCQAIPHVKLIMHGGTAMTPYRREFSDVLDGMTVDFLELLPSSESFMGYQRFGQQHMSLAPWYGTFFEFAPVEQLLSNGRLSDSALTVPLWQVEPGQQYALVLSTCSGLWRYHLGDTVKFHDTEAFQLEFTGRTRSLETFEEKVTQYEVEQSIGVLEKQCGITFSEYLVGPHILERCHYWILALRDHIPDEKQAALCLDGELQKQNDDYRTFRQQGRIAPPKVLFVEPTTLYSWSQTIRGRLGGQSKMPRIDPTGGDFTVSLLKYISEISC